MAEDGVVQGGALCAASGEVTGATAGDAAAVWVAWWVVVVLLVLVKWDRALVVVLSLVKWCLAVVLVKWERALVVVVLALVGSGPVVWLVKRERAWLGLVTSLMRWG